MLDDRPVHIHNVEAAVGAMFQIDRTKPRIGRGKELDALSSRPTFIDHSLRIQDFAMNQIARRIAS